ncbi:hypothetical protein H1C71_038511 [Ictidomys tridecemlineatus]|nr:hypothetical protein H1C71_038511 [Ictidomys tridecemlineatus]
MECSGIRCGSEWALKATAWDPLDPPSRLRDAQGGGPGRSPLSDSWSDLTGTVRKLIRPTLLGREPGQARSSSSQARGDPGWILERLKGVTLETFSECEGRLVAGGRIPRTRASPSRAPRPQSSNPGWGQLDFRKSGPGGSVHLLVLLAWIQTCPRQICRGSSQSSISVHHGSPVRGSMTDRALLPQGCHPSARTRPSGPRWDPAVLPLGESRPPTAACRSALRTGP